MNLKWTAKQVDACKRILEILQEQDTPSLFEVSLYCDIQGNKKVTELGKLQPNEIVENMLFSLEDDVDYLELVVKANM